MKNSSVLQHLRPWLPSRGNVLFTAITICALMVANRAGALTALLAPQSSTTTIHYQGRVTSPTGAAINGSPSMTFNLYSVPTGGTALWTEVYAAVPVTDGLFNVLLGSKTALPASLFKQNASLYLSIAIGADAEMSPREQLASAPYAMNASTVADGSVTSSTLQNGSVTAAKIATGAITTTHVADGSITDAKIAASSALTLVTVLQIGRYTAGNSATGSRMYTVTFPTAYTDAPIVMVTSELLNSVNTVDAFAVTLHNTTPGYFVVRVHRVDGAGWGGNLSLNWMAFKP